MKTVLIPQEITIVTAVFILIFDAFSRFDGLFSFYVHYTVVSDGINDPDQIDPYKRERNPV
jgi:hypothetical protein